MLGLHWEPISSETGQYDKKGGGEDPGSCRVRHYRIKNIVRAGKAYVIGLAFAVAGYSSFWLLAAMSVLLALVGINYMAICRHYPDGGGVYASVYHRSKIIAIIGAYLLIADYIVTAAIRLQRPALANSLQNPVFIFGNHGWNPRLSPLARHGA